MIREYEDAIDDSPSASDAAKPFSPPTTEMTRLDASVAIMALNKSEIDQKISTAKAYPRSIQRFQKNAMTMAILDQETAASMFYALPRSGKTIQGPSVRMAEVIACNWGNLNFGSRIISIDESFVTAQGVCFDLENNISATHEVKRRITRSDGTRYNDDMIGTTCNAACAIAVREAIFKVIPRALWKQIYQRSMKVAVGESTSMVDLRNQWFAYFAKLGVSKEQVLAVLERHGENDVTMEDLTILTGLSTALKDGEATVEGVFGLRDDQKKKVGISPLNERQKNGSQNGGSNGVSNGSHAPVSGKAHGNGNGNGNAKAVEPAKQESPSGQSTAGAGLLSRDVLDSVAECENLSDIQLVKQSYGVDMDEQQLAALKAACDVRAAEIKAAKQAVKS